MTREKVTKDMNNWLKKALETYIATEGRVNLALFLKEYAREKEFLTLLNSCSHSYPVTEEPHPTELKYPEQTKRFRKILDEMYQVHLTKNVDYSPYNINATGLVGAMVRIWDKTARLMNLLGFDIATGKYSGEKTNAVKNEGIEDSFIDLANYGIIARIYWEGKWGK